VHAREEVDGHPTAARCSACTDWPATRWPPARTHRQLMHVPPLGRHAATWSNTFEGGEKKRVRLRMGPVKALYRRGVTAAQLID
jgi:hypothetical protein